MHPALASRTDSSARARRVQRSVSALGTPEVLDRARALLGPRQRIPCADARSGCAGTGFSGSQSKFSSVSAGDILVWIFVGTRAPCCAALSSYLSTACTFNAGVRSGFLCRRDLFLPSGSSFQFDIRIIAAVPICKCLAACWKDSPPCSQTCAPACASLMHELYGHRTRPPTHKLVVGVQK